MRNIWVMSIVALTAGCSGGIGSQAYDKNHDGLVSQCEGLDKFFCELTPGCQGQALACIAVCVDDGKGGCGNPCADDFQCVPRPSTPSCALVPINSCASIPACEVQTQTVCGVSAGVSVPPDTHEKEVGCGGGCTTTQSCVNKQPQTCENRSVDSCTSSPECEVEYGGICEIACLPGSACPPCATAQARCVTRSVDVCESRSLAQCSSVPGCMVESYACPAVCEDDGKGGCLPCPGAPSRCVSIPSPQPAPEPESK